MLPDSTGKKSLSLVCTSLHGSGSHHRWVIPIQVSTTPFVFSVVFFPSNKQYLMFSIYFSLTFHPAVMTLYSYPYIYIYTSVMENNPLAFRDVTLYDTWPFSP